MREETNRSRVRSAFYTASFLTRIFHLTLRLPPPISGKIAALAETVFPPRPETIEVGIISRIADTESVLIEVGAMTGASTKALASIARNGCVIALEPNPYCFPMLRRRVRGSPNVRTFNIAAGNSNGNANFYISRLYDRGGSLLRHGNWKSCSVRMMPIDDLLSLIKVEKVDILLLDVEGTEADVLRGSSATLNRLNFVLVEIHHQKSRVIESDINKILGDHGLRPIERYVDSNSPLITVHLYSRTPFVGVEGGSAGFNRQSRIRLRLPSQ